MSLGERLVEIREELGLSQAQMSSKSGVSQGYLSQLENEGVSNPSTETILKIAGAVGLDPHILFKAGGFEIPSDYRFGMVSIPVDLDLLSFCSSLSRQVQDSLLGYLSDSPIATSTIDGRDSTPPKRKVKSFSRKPNITHLGSIILNFREEMGLSQGQLAERSEVSQGYLSQLENGVVKNPSSRILFQLASGLEKHVDELLEAAGFQVGRTLEDSYLQLCAKVNPELLGFFAKLSPKKQRILHRLLVELKQILEGDEPAQKVD